MMVATFDILLDGLCGFFFFEKAFRMWRCVTLYGMYPIFMNLLNFYELCFEASSLCSG